MSNSMRLLKLLLDVENAAAAQQAQALALEEAQKAAQLEAAPEPVEQGVVCACCNKSFTLLKRHLLLEHDMDEDSYRRTYGIAMGQPLVSPSYAARKAACVSAYRGAQHIRLEMQKPRLSRAFNQM